MALFGAKKNIQSDDKAVATKPAKAVKVAKSVSPEATEAGSMKDLYAAETTSTVKSKTGQTKEKKGTLLAYRTLVKPLITEKATNLSAENKYIFVVERTANKIAVARAIQEIYGVKPTAVNILNISGKAVSRGRIKGRRKNWRKAIVTLAKGQTIKIYEGV